VRFFQSGKVVWLTPEAKIQLENLDQSEEVKIWNELLPNSNKEFYNESEDVAVKGFLRILPGKLVPAKVGQNVFADHSREDFKEAAVAYAFAIDTLWEKNLSIQGINIPTNKRGNVKRGQLVPYVKQFLRMGLTNKSKS
jgi:hypothetical protein